MQAWRLFIGRQRQAPADCSPAGSSFYIVQYRVPYLSGSDLSLPHRGQMFQTSIADRLVMLHALIKGRECSNWVVASGAATPPCMNYCWMMNQKQSLLSCKDARLATTCAFTAIDVTGRLKPYGITGKMCIAAESPQSRSRGGMTHAAAG